MKRRLAVLLLALALLSLTGCGGGGNVRNVTILDWAPSALYTDSEVEAAIRTVKEYFRREFDGCTLTSLSYAGDAVSAARHEWAARYDADEAIVLVSSFAVDAAGGDGSLEPNGTYDNWQWILVRSRGGAWKHADHGYY